jgi:secreted trypsin-like serine protease
MYGDNIRTAREQEFPSAVAIIISKHRNRDVRNNLECTGALVSRKDVLTAAHCISDRQRNRVKILIGSTDLYNAREFRPLRWITFNDWHYTMTGEVSMHPNDIAMIKVNVSFQKIFYYIISNRIEIQ